MNKKEKFGVMVAMSMGVFAGVTSSKSPEPKLAVANLTLLF